MPLLEADPDGMILLKPEKRTAHRVGISVEMPETQALTWRATYNWSVAEDRLGGTTVPAPFDQRHGVHVDGTFKHRRWQLGAAWQAHSGWPSTMQTVALTMPNDTTIEFSRVIGPYNGQRLRSYQRLDVRAQHGWRIGGGRSELLLFADVMNVFNTRNLGWTASASTTLFGLPTEHEQIEMPMMLRTTNLGARWSF